MSVEHPAPGRASIEEAFRAVYGDTAPDVRVPPPPADGPAVLAGVAAYRGEDHWHLVTLGLTWLTAAQAEPGAERSGWGHELTLLTPPAERAPAWAFALLAGTARTVATVGRALHPGARLAPGEPVDGGRSGLIALGVREDPLVTPSSFPLGAYDLLQVVGVTLGEYGVMRKVGTALVLGKLAERDPLLRTDPARA